MDDWMKDLRSQTDPRALNDTPEGNNFNAKLSVDERCQVLALSYLGYKRNVLARAYGIHRATVRFITNRSSPHYKGVRQSFDDLGAEAFCRKHVTPEIIARTNQFLKEPEVHMSERELQELAAEKSNRPNRKADSKQGPHRITSRVFDGTHLFAVGWVDGPIPPRGAYPDEAERESGWYVFAPPDTVLSNAALFGELTDPPYCYTSQNASRTSASALAEFLAENEGEIT